MSVSESVSVESFSNFAFRKLLEEYSSIVMSVVLFTDISRTTIDLVNDSVNNVIVCHKFKITVNRSPIANRHQGWSSIETEE